MISFPAILYHGSYKLGPGNRLRWRPTDVIRVSAVPHGKKKRGGGGCPDIDDVRGDTAE